MDPVTRQAFDITDITPNWALRHAIQAWVAHRQRTRGQVHDALVLVKGLRAQAKGTLEARRRAGGGSAEERRWQRLRLARAEHRAAAAVVA